MNNQQPTNFNNLDKQVPEDNKGTDICQNKTSGTGAFELAPSHKSSFLPENFGELPFG